MNTAASAQGITCQLEITLTKSQAEAISLMMNFVQGEGKYFRLTGYAGTGKSFLVCHLMKWLQDQRINFVAGSPTNKAVKNLKNLARDFGLDIKGKTIAQLLGQQPELNEETGKEIFVSGKLQSSIADYDLVILDEFSMINKKNFAEIVAEVESSETKIIFVGDKAQLPPVKEKEPIVSTSPLIEDGYSLTEVVRYEGEIAVVAEAIRLNPKSNRARFSFQTTRDRSIIALSRDEWLDAAADYFEMKQARNNPDFVRFLVYRNQTAASLNQYIRTQLWGESPEAYSIGDLLIAKAPVFRPIPGGKGKNKWAIAMNNSEECQVIETAELRAWKTWQYWHVPVITDSGSQLKLSILTPTSSVERERQLREFAKGKRWRDYMNLSKRFDNISFAYALTTHKAQGSSIEYTFIDYNDLYRCHDRSQILYTALTRAKQRAFISLN
ncbi:MAG: AAA family ATPase [Prochloraceae cyanobacterium]|nr:AAA family ATPase [Prochloraceae cyanobacterium]